MSNELLAVLEYMEKEKGIGREDMIETISEAIRGAAQKGVNAGQDIKVHIDPKTGALKAWALYTVVDSIGDPDTEMHIDKARQIDAEAAVGSTLEKEIDPSYLGRIAAQMARHAIMQRIRHYEKERIYDDYKDSVGDIVSGTVRRRERGDLIVDLGKAEATLPPTERIPTEDYAPGERIRCLLLNIENTTRGPELILSRSSSKFVRKLFDLEVTEIAEGTVSIEAMSREPGYRTKIAVNTTDPKVDPVGACVGARGVRVKSIVRELGGEKVDIIRYHEDPKAMLEEALKPAVPKNIEINETTHTLIFEVPQDDLSVVIGRKGQNAKLLSRLLGWKLDIRKEEEKGAEGFDDRMRRAIEGLHNISGLEDAIVERLVAMGITTPDAFEGVTAADLVDAGFSEEEAADTLAKVDAFRQSQAS
tara:strand:+ start:24456 stop:25712 length:1257 start_codon:yes stop_codon:yes gene_type:complete